MGRTLYRIALFDEADGMIRSVWFVSRRRLPNKVDAVALYRAANPLDKRKYVEVEEKEMEPVIVQ